MRRFHLLSLLGGLSALISACGTAAPVSNGIQTMSPTKAEAAVNTAIKNSNSVRMAISVTQHGVTSSQILDSTKTGGIRTLEVQGGTAVILVTNKGAFLKAPSAILSRNFGLSATSASKDSGQWLSFATGTTAYFSLASGVGISSLAQEVSLTSVTRKVHPQINGVAVTALEGSSPSGKLDLYIPDAGPLLPIAGTISVNGSVVQFAFSRWGVPVDLTPPTSSKPFTFPPTTTSSSTATTSAAG